MNWQNAQTTEFSLGDMLRAAEIFLTAADPTIELSRSVWGRALIQRVDAVYTISVWSNDRWELRTTGTRQEIKEELARFGLHVPFTQ